MRDSRPGRFPVQQDLHFMTRDTCGRARDINAAGVAKNVPVGLRALLIRYHRKPALMSDISFPITETLNTEEAIAQQIHNLISSNTLKRSEKNQAVAHSNNNPTDIDVTMETTGVLPVRAAFAENQQPISYGIR
jgi:hypothetical protein